MSERYLPTALRRILERVIKDARIAAEDGARDAIRRLGVADSKAPGYLSVEEKELRRRLRAHARALGDPFDRKDQTQATKHLVEAAAYAHWHRMLFARFLAERGLLRNPEYDVAVTLEDCRELAEAEGLADPWAIAERYSAAMLPAVFRIDDPVLALELDPVHAQKLQKLVTGLDAVVFQAEDSLGWTYQFWRAAEKDAVNASGVKIGADELPAVTQLFTEPYMVRFLLHNTLGAWWAGKVLAGDPALAQNAEDEGGLRVACSLPDYSFDMLRFVRDSEDGSWRPAAGTFPGWPTEAKAITMLDPCCGSGHFLTEALAILAALRQVEESLSPADAVAAALLDNLHGLEIDGRCVQLAAFAVALTAWRIGGWQLLPLPQVAWVGAPPPLVKREFVALAGGDVELEYALDALHDLFADAPTLGSLIEPAGGDLFEAERLREIERLLGTILERARRAEPDLQEGIVAARGMSDAASLLYKKYVLQITNVPFLGRGRQDAILSAYLSRHFDDSKADLATAMIERMRKLASDGGSFSFVSPQNWLFLGPYKKLRQRLISISEMKFVAALGSGAFETIGGEVVNTVLMCFSKLNPEPNNSFSAIDANNSTGHEAKKEELLSGPIVRLSQSSQAKNPSSTIAVQDVSADHRLGEYAESFAGVCTGDYPRFGRNFWEVQTFGKTWELQRTTTNETRHFGGASQALRWEGDSGSLRSFVEERLGEKNAGSWLRGYRAWGKRGISVKLMSSLPVSIYEGELFDDNVAVLLPRDSKHLGAIFAFCESNEFSEEVRRLNQKLAVKTQYLLAAPFELERWQQKFSKNYPNGLPEPYSDNPTQWFFHGHPIDSISNCALLIGLARICGYKWPAESDSEIRLSENTREWIARARELPGGDNDGLLGVPAVAGEKPLADRLRAYLISAYGSEWSDNLERRLVEEADEALDKKKARDGSLEAWVRDRAYRQHCILFGQRPFLWHITDGLKDGFSVFVHYHRFDQANLRKLTYTLLGDWLARAKAENNVLRVEKGRELQQKLEKILEGEAPYDIFVRWKSLAQQPLGWGPDLDDGVRMNIRPFVEAGILQYTPKIKWAKDRGKDVTSAPWYPVFKGDRINDHHTTLEEKRAAREEAVRRVGSTS
jgi:Eco57I restriction-modification methylase